MKLDGSHKWRILQWNDCCIERKITEALLGGSNLSRTESRLVFDIHLKRENHTRLTKLAKRQTYNGLSILAPRVEPIARLRSVSP
eukprot:scaffold1690_cov182-Amphora_coffeaeformis.AAC.12